DRSAHALLPIFAQLDRRFLKKCIGGRSSRTFRISCGSARRGNAPKKDCIESGLSDGKQIGSLMKASTSALSRLSQSNGVRAGSNAAFINFIGSSPGDIDSARRAKPSRMP